VLKNEPSIPGAIFAAKARIQETRLLMVGLFHCLSQMRDEIQITERGTPEEVSERREKRVRAMDQLTQSF
jgi:hypothetical protein